VETLLTFAAAAAAIYGIVLLIGKVAQAFGSSASREFPSGRHYDFYDPNKPRRPADPIITRVAGVTFEGRQTVVRGLRPEQMLELLQEPDNPHDPNAVKVVTKAGDQVGYVPRELASDLAWAFDASYFTRPAKVLEVVGDERKGQSLGVIIEIYPPTLEEALYTSNLRYPPF
jgi:hypothetical protein